MCIANLYKYFYYKISAGPRVLRFRTMMRKNINYINNSFTGGTPQVFANFSHLYGVSEEQSFENLSLYTCT